MLCMPAPRDRAPNEVLRRRRIGIALVVCVAVGIVCFFTLRPSEPEYGDKPLSRWVEQLFTNYPRVDAEARDAIRAMGQPAVRVLTKIVDHEPSAWRLRLASVTAEIPLINRLFSVATFDSLFATKALAEIGPTATLAIPALERAAKDKDRMLSLSARAALIRIRGESIESQIATFRQFGTTNSAQMSFLLTELGPHAMPALPALLEGLESTNDRVRHYATMALASIGCESPECVPPLQRLLSDPSHLVRCAALDGLAHIGPPAITALQNVRQSLRDSNNLVRSSALWCLDNVLSDEEFSTVRDEVIRAKLDTDPTVSGMAQHVLSSRPHGNSGSATKR
jgi:HEAT repeat protein